MILIQTSTLESAAAEIEFTSIPQTPFTDLVVLLSARSSQSAPISAGVVRPNGTAFDDGNFSSLIQGTGSVAAAFGLGNAQIAVSGATATANTFGNMKLYFPEYARASSKTYVWDVVSENNATAANLRVNGGLTLTGALTSLVFSLFDGNFVAGSTASLYGITKGSDGIVTTS